VATFEFEDPFDDSFEDILASLFEQVEILWPDPDNRPDLREGSLLWTLMSPFAFEIQRFQADLNLALQIGFIQFTFGEFLDLKGVEVGLERKQGSEAEGVLRFLGSIGTVVPLGTTAANLVETAEEEVYFYDTTESGTLQGIPTPINVNESQKISVEGTGRFVLTLDGATTTPLLPNSLGSTISAALNALAPTPTYPTIVTTGDSGIANAGGATVTFGGGSVAGRDIPPLTYAPYQVNEEQQLVISGAGTFEITFDGDETNVNLTENSTGTDIVNAINGLVPTTANTYGTFSVSTTTPSAQVDAPGGVVIVFDGGGVQYTNVPTLQVTDKTGTISETITTLAIGEDSDAVLTIDETVKGRRAAPSITTSDQNEIQRLEYTTPSPEVSTLVDGAPGSTNQVQRLTVAGVPVSGDFVLTFNDGSTSYSTSPITPSATAATIESFLAALPNIGSAADVNVTIVSGGPALSAGNAIMDIEFVGNLRNQNYPLLTVGANTLQDAGLVTVTPSVGIMQAASTGLNERQKVSFADQISGAPTGPYPDGGEVSFVLSDAAGSGSNTVGPVPFDATAGLIQDTLENSVLYGRGTSNIFTANFGDGAANLEAALEALPGVGVGNVTVTLISGGPQISTGPSAVYDVEFTNGLANQGLPLMKVKASTNTFSPATSLVITRVVAGSPTLNEKQRLTFTGTPTSGDVDVQFYAPSVFGDNFIVTGGPLHQNPVVIEYTGKNRYKNFNPVSLIEDLAGTPTSGNYRLNYNGGTSTVDIGWDDSTQDVESKLNATSTVTSAGGLTVRVANGIQTLEYSGGTPTSGVFQLIVDDGVSAPETTSNLNWNASPVDVKVALEALTNVGASNIEVYSSGAPLDTMADGATYTVHFLNSNSTLYRHMLETASTLNNAAVVEVGPHLGVSGAAYEIEFDTAGTRSVITYEDDATLTLAPAPNEPVISRLVTGDLAVREKQVLSLTHPAGLFSLQWGSGANTTALISPYFDDSVSVGHKIEALFDIDSVTVTGGPLSTSPMDVEFSGPTLSATDWPMFSIINNSITGGHVYPIQQVQVGFGGSGGSITGTVQYLYTVVSNLGIQDGARDIDYEVGFGETGPSVQSAPLVVSNNRVLVEIDPLLRGEGLVAPRKVRVFRRLTTGFTSSPWRLIGTIEESGLQLVDLNGSNSNRMYVVDDAPLSLFNATAEIAPDTNTTGVLDVEAVAQEIGEAQNLAERVIEVLDDPIVGIVRVTNPEPFGGGSDIETDDEYRDRLIEFIQKDPGAGNIDDYVSWAREVEGVSGATCIPEWQEIYGPLEGPGTVKVVVAGENSTILPDATIEEVRQYIAGTIAIPDPDQEFGPASLALPGGSIEDGVYEYVYTFINVGKGETKPSAISRVIVGGGNNSVELSIQKGQGGIGVQNTIGRRIYRRKVDGSIANEVDSEKFVLVAELLENSSTSYVDTAAFADLPTWLGYPNGNDGTYQRRKAPRTNSTSVFDGEAPIGAHVTVESISEETIWVNATVLPSSGYSLDGSGGKLNLTSQLDAAIQNLFQNLDAGEDIKHISIANVLHDHPGVFDFKDLVLFSPLFPLGTTSNISIGPGVSPQYSAAGTFTLWTGYPFDK